MTRSHNERLNNCSKHQATGQPQQHLEDARARIARDEDELERARLAASSLAAEVDEAQTRAETLAEVVKVETAKHEQFVQALAQERAQTRARQAEIAALNERVQQLEQDPG